MTAAPSANLLHSSIPIDVMGGLDWVGTLAFALSGALVGVRKRV